MSQGRVLVAEDDEELCVLLKIRFEEAGYEVVTVRNGDEVFTRLKELAPHVIVLDVFLPDMDGLTILKRLKSEYDIVTGDECTTKNIPVVMITGKAPMVENMTRVEGAADFFVKPFEMTKLVKRVGELIEARNRKGTAL